MTDQISGEILGWYNDEGVVLCSKCFAKKHQHHDVNWTPIKRKDKEEDVDTCSECKNKLF